MRLHFRSILGFSVVEGSFLSGRCYGPALILVGSGLSMGPFMVYNSWYVLGSRLVTQ